MEIRYIFNTPKKGKVVLVSYLMDNEISYSNSMKQTITTFSNSDATTLPAEENNVNMPKEGKNNFKIKSSFRDYQQTNRLPEKHRKARSLNPDDKEKDRLQRQLAGKAKLHLLLRRIYIKFDIP